LVKDLSPNQKIESLVQSHFTSMECNFVRLVIQVQELQIWEPKMALKCGYN